MQSEADAYFARQDYSAALKYYKQAGTDHSEDKKARLHMAISMYEVNDVDGALALLNSINNEGKTDPDVFYYIARCFEAKNLFTEAIGSYKRFLQRTGQEEPRRVWVKDQIIRCANGMRLRYADESAYVENAGTTINTPYADFGVKNSPTNIGKIYFNSDRESATGSGPEVDIFAAELVNGRWSTPSILPQHINAGPYQEVYGFSNNGQILYYLIKQENAYRIRTDTFTEITGVTRKGYFRGPISGTDVTFFNDSICLYASNEPGGYGGYDLYVSFLKGEAWTKGINLGPVINSFYDERFPFLTRNGLTLFYSSNNLKSVGGLDVFSTSFDPASYKWSPPQNLGFPINSTGDDSHLVVAPDGTNAYLTSDRKEGYGGKDIYRVFFKQPLIAHQEISDVPTFQQLLLAQETAMQKGETVQPAVEVKEYFISHLFLEENGDILTPQNIKKLDLLANMMLIYPKIIAELSTFEIPNGQPTFLLYFSVKKSEEAANYLMRKGVAANRLLLKGYGPSFPLATLPDNGANTSLYKKLNFRIEINLHHFEMEPVVVHMENITVPDYIMDPKGQKFAALRHGFYYSVQLTSITQILQNPALESMPEVFIEVDNVQGNYLYMAGMLSSFAQADNLRKELINSGFPDAKVIPYLDGLRIKAEDVPVLVNTYPDLLLFQGATKE